MANKGVINTNNEGITPNNEYCPLIMGDNGGIAPNNGGSQG